MGWRYEPDMPNYMPAAMPTNLSRGEAKSMKKTVKMLQELGVIPKPDKKEEKKDDKKKEPMFTIPQYLGILNLMAPIVVVLQFMAVKFCLTQFIEMAHTLTNAH